MTYLKVNLRLLVILWKGLALENIIIITANEGRFSNKVNDSTSKYDATNTQAYHVKSGEN